MSMGKRAEGSFIRAVDDVKITIRSSIARGFENFGWEKGGQGRRLPTPAVATHASEWSDTATRGLGGGGPRYTIHTQHPNTPTSRIQLHAHVHSTMKQKSHEVFKWMKTISQFDFIDT